MKLKISEKRALFFLSFVFILLCANLGFSTDKLATKRPSTTREYSQDWKEFSSASGGFSILFPKVPNESSGTLNIGQTIINQHTFTVRDDSLYTVMYFDVPHLNDLKTKADLLVGFRSFVLATLKGELISDYSVSIENNAGRLLEMSVPKRGKAKALILVTDTRLYEISVVPEKRVIPDEDTRAASTRFLESFRLLAIDRSAEGEVDAYLRSNPELAQRAIQNDKPKGLLNGKAVRLPPPEFSLLARGVHASGTIIVRIIIDVEGRVIAAQAVGGHPLLVSAAEAAARKALFTPTLEEGKPVKVLGKVQYNFISR